MYADCMTSPSPRALRRFAHVADPDEARDMAFDYDADLDAQYDDYVAECAEAGVTPLPYRPRA